MLGFVGEDFNKACLTFHKNRRYARTASYAQVTEPLYKRSVHRYQHYRQHLEPVIPLLEDQLYGNGVDVAEEYGLASLRDALGAGRATAIGIGQPSPEAP